MSHITPLHHYQGFFSYFRETNEKEHGQLSAIREILESEIKQITSDETFRIFQDTQSLEFGDDWRSKINRALDDSIIFIAVAEKSYLLSAECRYELKGFLHRMKEDPKRILLTIYYEDCGLHKPVSEENDEELLKALKKYYYYDWRHLREIPLVHNDIKFAVQEIAKRYAEFCQSKIDASEIETARESRRQALINEIKILKKRLDNAQTSEEQRLISSEIVKLTNMLKDAAEYQSRLTGAVISANETTYTLLRRIKYGAAGEVWEAISDSTKRVAIKLLHPWHHDDLTVSEQFKRGAQYQKSFQHNNIVQVIGGPYEYKSERFFVMEYIKGKDLLDEVLDQSALPVSEGYFNKISKGIISICDALKYINEEHSIAHGDICPSNIIIGENGKAYLTDFDNIHIAKLDHGTNQSQLGTHPYIDPELYSEDWKNKNETERNKFFQRADIYSLTLTLLFCLLRRSLQSKEILQQFHSSGWKSVIDGVDCSSEVRRLLKKGIIERKERFTSIQEFSDALKRIRSFGPTSWMIRHWRHALVYLGITLTIIAAILVPIYLHQSKLYEQDLQKALSEKDKALKERADILKKMEDVLEEHSSWLLVDQRIWDNDTSAIWKSKYEIYEMFRNPNSGFNKKVDTLIQALSQNNKISDKLLYDEKFFTLLETSAEFPKTPFGGYKYDPDYAIWSPARDRSENSIPDTSIKPNSDPNIIFAGISRILITGSSKTKNRDLVVHLASLLGIPPEVRENYRPILIFVGYQNLKDPTERYTFFYPAYEFPGYKKYDPATRDWWKAATEGYKTITFNQRERGYKDGLCAPYSTIDRNTFPPRAYWRYVKIRSSMMILAIDFVFDPRPAQAK